MGLDPTEIPSPGHGSPPQPPPPLSKGLIATGLGPVSGRERCRGRHCCLAAQGPVSVLVGTGGKQTTPQYFARAQPAWSVRRHSAYGYGNVTVTRDTFDFQFVDSKDGTVQDHFTLHRNGTVEDHWRGRSTG